MAPIPVGGSIHRRGIENLGYFFKQDKAIIAAAIVLAIGLGVVLFIGLFIHSTYRCIRDKRRKMLMNARKRKVDRENEKAQKEALLNKQLDPESIPEPDLDQLQPPAPTYDPAPYYSPEYLAGSDRSQPARSIRRQYPASVRSLSVSDHSSIPLSRCHTAIHSQCSDARSRSFRSPTPLSFSTTHMARPVSSRSNRPLSVRSGRPASVMSGRTGSVGSNRALMPATMAPEPIIRQQELWRNYIDLDMTEEVDGEAEGSVVSQSFSEDERSNVTTLPQNF